MHLMKRYEITEHTLFWGEKAVEMKIEIDPNIILLLSIYCQQEGDLTTQTKPFENEHRKDGNP